MLEHIPAWLGRTLSGVRAGAEKLAVVELGAGLPELELMSPAFGHGGRLPPRFTADGAGTSPPLVWIDPPPGTARRSCAACSPPRSRARGTSSPCPAAATPTP